MMVVHYKDETVDVFDDVYDCITKHGIITIQYDAEEERVYPKDESGRTIADQSIFHYSEVKIPISLIKRIDTDGCEIRNRYD